MNKKKKVKKKKYCFKVLFVSSISIRKTSIVLKSEQKRNTLADDYEARINFLKKKKIKLLFVFIMQHGKKLNVLEK